MKMKLRTVVLVCSVGSTSISMDLYYNALHEDRELDAICYSVPRKRREADPHLIETLELENYDLKMRIHDLEVEQATSTSELDFLRNEVKKLTERHADSHLKHMETIAQQGAQILQAEDRIRELSSELNSCEQQRHAMEAHSSSRSVRILDLERQVSTLTAEVQDCELKAQTSSERVGDLANELMTLQKRLESQRDLNSRLEQQLLHIQSMKFGSVDNIKTSQEIRLSRDSTPPVAAVTSVAPHSTAGVKPVIASEAQASRPVVGVYSAKARAETDYDLAQQLESDLLEKCKLRDGAEAKLRRLEDQKLRTISEKAKRDALAHEVSVLTHEISDIRTQLRSMHQLFK